MAEKSYAERVAEFIRGGSKSESKAKANSGASKRRKPKGKPSIAERINFGGRGEQLRKEREGR